LVSAGGLHSVSERKRFGGEAAGIETGSLTMSISFDRISVIGAGAMGAAYASMFYEMDPHCISFIANGERAARLKAEGLTVNGRTYSIPVVTREDRVPPSDLVMVAVKNHHLPEALPDMKTVVGENTLFLSVMNGIESEEQIGAVYGAEKVLYAVAVGIDAMREGNRVSYSKKGKLYFGEASNSSLTTRVKALHTLFKRAGIACEIPEDMIRTLWWKFMINVGINQASAVLRAPYGVFQTFPEARELMESAMLEVIAVAKVAGVHLSNRDIEDWHGFLSTLAATGKTSMLQDIEAGRKMELEIFSGKVISLGKHYHVPTPVNGTLFRILRVAERRFLPS
jgi:2-dehydropantoate 2-reductase